jgi:hypothetical protein
MNEQVSQKMGEHFNCPSPKGQRNAVNVLKIFRLLCIKVNNGQGYYAKYEKSIR